MAPTSTSSIAEGGRGGSASSSSVPPASAAARRDKQITSKEALAEDSHASSAEIDAFLEGRGCHSPPVTSARENCEDLDSAAGNKRKRSAGGICKKDGCTKYRTGKCEGYCTRCYKENQGDDDGDAIQPPSKQGKNTGASSGDVTGCRTSDLVFKPIKSKSSLERKSCICDWGQDCIDFKRYFDHVKHPLGGTVQLQFSNSCYFHNFWAGICHFINPSESKKDELTLKHEVATGEGGKLARFVIAKHHFPQELVAYQSRKGSSQWVSPLSRWEAECIRCYEGRSIPPHADLILIYDPTLGEGMSEKWQRYNQSMIRKTPCTKKEDVRLIAALHQHEASGEMTLEEWKARLSEKDTQNDILAAENGSLKAQLEKVQNELVKLQSKRVEEKREREKQKMRAKREQEKMEKAAAKAKEEASDNDVNGAGWQKVNGLLSKSGGLSRLTLFNDAWHVEHKEAANRLWGYPSWEETKRRVSTYFPNEEYGVYIYDPSKNVKVLKNGDMVLPELTQFEMCLICRMSLLGSVTDTEIMALIFDRHRTRIGQLMKQWTPRWENHSEDMKKMLDLRSKRKEEIVRRDNRVGKSML